MNATEEIAHRKRRIERLLRGIGFSHAKAKRGAALIVAKYDQDFCSRPSTPWDAGREASKQYAEQSQLPAPARVMPISPEAKPFRKQAQGSTKRNGRDAHAWR